jgi:DNA-binding response OmpR family regulator
MTATQRVLVVEDDPDVAQALWLNLADAGFDVTVATDGLSALRAFDQVHPDLATVDLSLPQVSGFRLIELFKRFRPDMPVIVVSGLSFEEAEDVARRMADDYLDKPFDPAGLVAKIRYLLHPPTPASSPLKHASRSHALVTA